MTMISSRLYVLFNFQLILFVYIIWSVAFYKRFILSNTLNRGYTIHFFAFMFSR